MIRKHLGTSRSATSRRLPGYPITFFPPGASLLLPSAKSSEHQVQLAPDLSDMQSINDQESMLYNMHAGATKSHMRPWTKHAL